MLPRAQIFPDRSQRLEPFQVETAFVHLFRMTLEAIFFQERLDTLDVGIGLLAA